MKRNEYIIYIYIYLYIMKYHDLVFEVEIENDTFRGSYMQSALFRVILQHHLLSWVTVGYTLSSFLLVFGFCLSTLTTSF